MSDIKVVISSDNKYITKFQNVGLNGQDGDITTSNIGTKVNGLITKSALVSADRILIADSEESYVGKKSTVSYLKSFVLDTPTVEGLMTLNSGQIKFPTTKNPSSNANTLDDYEEGSFTPAIIGATTAGVGTYARQNGIYVKIGRLVVINVDINYSAHTGAGGMRIQGLPFNPVQLTPVSIRTSDVTSTKSTIVCYVNTSGVIFIQEISAASPAATDVAMDTSGSISLFVTYLTS